ncbi:MAG: NRDE family protein [Deltaproteobacteria bacterium]|nr:NRDE family protein [Deltaproteobacteria bacterium]
MCLIAVALDPNPAYRLVVLANRDEYLDRPARPLQPWTEPVGVVAGVDAGADRPGTWLAWHPAGRWAAVTNVREPHRPDRGRLSRGRLPLLGVSGPPPQDVVAALAADNALDPSTYGGYNLLCGDGHSAWWVSNRATDPIALPRGLHGLSNAALDTPWPKVRALRGALAALVQADPDGTAPTDAWFAPLLDRTCAADPDLPATGVPLPVERALSAAFVALPGYGTRSSTVLRWWRDGRWRIDEWTHTATSRDRVWRAGVVQ